MTDLTNPIFQDEAKAREHLEALRWPDGPYCPRCGDIENVKRLGGKAGQKGQVMCNSCRKKFTVTIGTLFERSHIPLHKWVLAFHLMAASKKGMSAHQLHRMLGITYKSAWFMAHRIREAMRDDNPKPMGGSGQQVEVDETYIGSAPKDEDYTFVSGRGWFLKRRRKQKILSLVERGGRARSIHIDAVDARTVRGHMVTNISRESDLMTDEASIYKVVGKEFASHQTVNHSKYEYARGEASTNTIEGFFSIFKRGMKGIYQHCGEQHLQRYLHEFDFRYNHRKIEDAERASKALLGIEGKRLTYRRTNAA